MLEKSRLTPSRIGLASAELAPILKRFREIRETVISSEGCPEQEEWLQLSKEAERIKSGMSTRNIRKLYRLTEDHIQRVKRRDGVSLEFIMRLRDFRREGMRVTRENYKILRERYGWIDQSLDYGG